MIEIEIRIEIGLVERAKGIERLPRHAGGRPSNDLAIPVPTAQWVRGRHAFENMPFAELAECHTDMLDSTIGRIHQLRPNDTSLFVRR